MRVHFDRKKKSGPTKEGSVEIEVYYDNSRRWISTGIKILPKYWNRKQNIISGHVDSLEMNTSIENIVNKVKSTIRTIIMEGRDFTWEEYDALVADPKGVRDAFIKFVEKRVSERQDIVEGTRKNHRKFLKALKEFGEIRTFSNITKLNIMKFDSWIRQRRDYTQSTIHTYHKCMKVYINEAIRLEHISYNPYESIRIDRGKSTVRKYLTEDEVNKLETVELPTDSLKRVRDLFIFQCYTGLAYADLSKFDFSQVVERKGRFVLHDVRVKTGEDFYIVLMPKAMAILRSYDFTLPVMSNAQYNLRIKAVADIAGVNKALTTHMGRHTFASMCLNAGVSIEVLAKMLGHSNIGTTQLYAKMINHTVEAAYDLLK